MKGKTPLLREMAALCGLLLVVAMPPVYEAVSYAQTAPAATAAGRKIGTVDAITGSGFSLTSDDGQKTVITIQDGARVLQLLPGSKDLKSAQPITLKDIAVGDRVLVSGKAADDTRTFAAMLVVLMKASDIAQQHTAEQTDWQKRGVGGIVSAADAGTGSLTLAVGAKKISVVTSGQTKFRRYAGDSVKFEDAKPGTLAQIQTGDQLRVRGARSEDGSSIQAEEVVSGSFKNVSGVITTLDRTAGTLSLKDLATKKAVTVSVTANTSIRSLPPEAAARFAARAKSAAPPSGESNTQSQTTEGGATRRSAGADLSDLVNRLPNEAVGDLKTGEAVMIVASQSDPGSSVLTAITVLSGVEPILAAAPSGSAMTLSPWSVGGSDSASQ